MVRVFHWGAVLVAALILPALAHAQRKDPAVSFTCYFQLNGVRLCLIKHFEASGLDTASGEVRLTTSDLNAAFRTAMFDLLAHKPAVNSASLVFLDPSLKNASSLEMGSVSLKEIEMPDLNKAVNAIAEMSFRLSVSNVTRPAAPPASPKQAASVTAGTPGQGAKRQDPLVRYLFRLEVEGLNPFAMNEISEFRVAPGGAGQLVLTVRGQSVANEFVNWKGSKAATLDLQSPTLQSICKFGFTLTKRRLTEEWDLASGFRVLKIECGVSGFAAVRA